MMNILDLMIRLNALKQTARTGWNKKFPEDHPIRSRCVPEAESVADHSWGLAIFAFLVGTELKLNAEKMAIMALVHDVAESLTTDIVTATLDHEEKIRVEAEKRVIEEVAVREIFSSLGFLGERCIALWLEFEDGDSEEAIILRQLDKMECAIQAVLYQEQGHTVRSNEFVAYTQKYTEHPELVEMLSLLGIRSRA